MPLVGFAVPFTKAFAVAAVASLWGLAVVGAIVERRPASIGELAFGMGVAVPAAPFQSTQSFWRGGVGKVGVVGPDIVVGGETMTVCVIDFCKSASAAVSTLLEGAQGCSHALEATTVSPSPSVTTWLGGIGLFDAHGTAITMEDMLPFCVVLSASAPPDVSSCEGEDDGGRAVGMKITGSRDTLRLNFVENDANLWKEELLQKGREYTGQC